MKAVGAHLYFGAMGRGVEAAGFDVVGSMETWPVGIQARAMSAEHFCKRCSAEEARMSGPDLVFANPPCSRYSSAASGHYSDQDKGDLQSFADLRDVVDLTIDTGAKSMWWETGPHLWTRGSGMVRSTAQALRESWDDDVTSMVVRIDPRWLGVPQRRPRCHVLHLRGRHKPSGSFGPSKWPEFAASGATLKSWVAAQLRLWGHDGLHTPAYPRSWVKHWDTAPSEWTQQERKYSTFSQGAPILYKDDRLYSLAVLSGRCAAWESEDRWVSVEEWAAIMTVPPMAARAVALQTNGRHAITMLSKGVCPSVARAVGEYALKPALLSPAPPHDAWEYAMDDIWRIDLRVGDEPRTAA